MWALTWPRSRSGARRPHTAGAARSATPPRPGSAATRCRPAADPGDPGRRLPPDAWRAWLPLAAHPAASGAGRYQRTRAGTMGSDEPQISTTPPPDLGRRNRMGSEFESLHPAAASPSASCPRGGGPGGGGERSSTTERATQAAAGRTLPVPPSFALCGQAPLLRRCTPYQPPSAIERSTQELHYPDHAASHTRDGAYRRANHPPRRQEDHHAGTWLGLAGAEAPPRVLGRRVPRTRPEPGTVTTPGARSTGRSGRQRAPAEHQTAGQRPHDPFAILDVQEVRSSIPAAEVASLAGAHPKACRKVPGHRIPRSAWDLRARRAVRGGSEP